MGINTVPNPPYSPDLAPCDFLLFPKLRGCHYETTEEMKEAVTKVIDMLTQEDFYGAFQKLLEWYNMCVAAGGDYFEGNKSFMCVLSIKVPIQKRLKTYPMHLVLSLHYPTYYGCDHQSLSAEWFFGNCYDTHPRKRHEYNPTWQMDFIFYQSSRANREACPVSVSDKLKNTEIFHRR